MFDRCSLTAFFKESILAKIVSSFIIAKNFSEFGHFQTEYEIQNFRREEEMKLIASTIGAFFFRTRLTKNTTN